MSVSPNSETSIDQITRTTQIIHGALIAGVTTFLLVVIGLVHFVGFSLVNPPAAAPGQAAGPNPPAGLQLGQSIPILTYMSVGLAAILLPLSFILPGIVGTQSLRAAAARKAEDKPGSTPSAAGALSPATAFQTSAIIGAALTEGPAFFAGIAYLIEQNPIALVVFGVLLAALVLRFPTRDRVERWISQQEEKLRWESS